ncbi:MAG: excinuclease ABC subunit UvrB [Bacteriovoracales bacterium]|nr:excinuclease ABC subunit UvrB [Bacteriovoracales bacterium]
MSHFKVISTFRPTGDQPRAIKTLVENFKNSSSHETLLGVTGSGKTFTVANVIEILGKKALVLAPNKTLAAQLYAEFKEFFPHNAVEYFVSYYDYYQPEAYIPGTDTYIEKDASINDEIDKLRHSTTRSLLERDDVIVVASVSCIYGLGSPEEYERQKVTLFSGSERERDHFIRDLISIQYLRNDIEFSRGTFRVRGDIVEVFPASEEEFVLRFEFFDDVVESIYLVDPLKGKVLQSLNKATVYPSSHYVVGKERLKAAINGIKVELRERLMALKSEGKLLEKQRLEQRTLFDIEMLEEMGFCSGIENYSRHLTGLPAGAPPYTLIDFFKKNFLLVVDESHLTVPQLGGMYKGDRGRKLNLVEHGFRLPSALDNRPLAFDEFEDKLDQVLFISATPSDFEFEKCRGEVVEQVIRPTGLVDPIVEVRKADNQLDDIILESKRVIKSGFRVLITTLTKKLAENLTECMKGMGLRVRYLHSDVPTIKRVEIIRDLRLGKFDILVGINLLREGLDLPEVALVGILDADKEGFLRSERSLIQTIGRAARNAYGKAILYAYKTTPSMKRAMEETTRRRKKQEDYNREHKIIPQTISKEVKGGIIDTLRGAKINRQERKKKFLEEMSPERIDQEISRLKKLMKDYARELEFEKAANVRDEIKSLNEVRLLF